MHTQHHATLALAAALTIPTLILQGCSGISHTNTAPTPPVERNLDQTRVLDIQVARRNTRISMTNTTANDLGPGTLWVNQRFARDIEGLAVGQTIDLSLKEFYNEEGEPFRAGGFFAIEDPVNVVLVQYATEDDTGNEQLLGFIVVENTLE